MMWNPRWRPRNGCGGRLIAKFLIATIQANLCCHLQVSLGFSPKFTWIVVIKIFTINLPSQPFLGRLLGFHIFFRNGHLGGRTLFFTAIYTIVGLDFTSLCNCLLQCWHIAIKVTIYSIKCVGGINYTICFFSSRNKEFQQMCCGSNTTFCTCLFSVKNNNCSWVCGPQWSDVL